MGAGLLVEGAIGAVIEYSLEELNASCAWDIANFDPDNDTVEFKFDFSDGTSQTFTGAFVSDGVVQYTTTADTELAAAGRCEIQVRVTTVGGDVIPFEKDVIEIGESNY